MSQKGKSQVQRDAEIRLSKLEAERGEGVGRTFTIIMHDFIGGDHPTPPDRFTEDGTRIRIISTPEEIREWMAQKDEEK